LMRGYNDFMVSGNFRIKDDNLSRTPRSNINIGHTDHNTNKTHTTGDLKKRSASHLPDSENRQNEV